MSGFDNDRLITAKNLAKTSFNAIIQEVVDEIFNGVTVPQEAKNKIKENYIKVNNKTVDSLLAVLYQQIDLIIREEAKVIIEGSTYAVTFIE